MSYLYRMKVYKVIITKDQLEINQWLRDGWAVHSVTAQHVSIGDVAVKAEGNFCFVLTQGT